MRQHMYYVPDIGDTLCTQKLLQLNNILCNDMHFLMKEIEKIQKYNNAQDEVLEILVEKMNF